MNYFIDEFFFSNVNLEVWKKLFSTSEVSATPNIRAINHGGGGYKLYSILRHLCFVELREMTQRNEKIND